MADEEVMGATSPAQADYKRKLEDLELLISSVNGDASDDSDAKRPRLDQNLDGLDLAFASHRVSIAFLV